MNWWQLSDQTHHRYYSTSPSHHIIISSSSSNIVTSTTLQSTQLYTDTFRIFVLYNGRLCGVRQWRAQKMTATGRAMMATKNGLDWIEQGLTSPPTQYRLSGRQFYRSKDPTNSIKVLKANSHAITNVPATDRKRLKTHQALPTVLQVNL